MSTSGHANRFTSGVRLIDLSIPVLEEPNPFYPEHPWFSYRRILRHGTSVFESNAAEMFLHAGSHIDAPYHFDSSGTRIDQVPLERVVGPGFVLDLSDVQDDELISADRLERAKGSVSDSGDAIVPGMIALLRTDWSKRARPPDKKYWQGSPFLDREAAEWLVAQDVSAVGFDFPQDKNSAEGVGRLTDLEPGGPRLIDLPNPPQPVHVTLLFNGICQIENIANLDLLPSSNIMIVAAPILLVGAEGAPARVFAICPNS
jgi:arylformamidase